MKSVCAWCGRMLVDEPAGEASGRVSHGICASCLAEVSADRPRALKDFLDRLPEPVLCTGGNVDLVVANAAAERLLGRDLSAAAGMLGGDLLACAWARLPGGCGKTVHCAACAVRRTVTEVHATGRAVLHAPAWIARGTAEGGGRQRLEISAEKAGDVVLLRIDRMGGPAG